MLQLLREEKEGKLQMLVSLRENGLTSLFKEVRVFKVCVNRIRLPLTSRSMSLRIGVVTSLR